MDLLMGYSSGEGANYLGVQLGNGDGTFGSLYQLRIDSGLTQAVFNPQLQLIDINADGKLDAVFGSGQVALGNGDGTFSLSTPLLQLPYIHSYTLLAMNIFPDSASSLVFTNLGIDPSNGVNAVFTPQDSSGAATSVALSAGSHSLTAHYSGDSAYAATVSPAVVIDVTPAVTTTTVTSSANPSYAGQSVTFTAGVAGLTPGASGTVTFSNGSKTLGTAAVSNGSASFATTLTGGGNQIITAAYGGDGNDAASSGTVNQAVESPISIPTPPSGPTTLTVASGSSVSSSITINAIAGYSGLLSLTCSGLPANASCGFTPQIPTIAAPSGTYGIIVATNSSESLLGKVQDSATPPAAVEWCGISLLGLLFMGRVRRSRMGRLCLVLAAGVFVSLAGCGGSSKSTTTAAVTPPGTYTFQVNAATGQVNGMPYSSPVSQTYTLIVQ
jgi:hypothetical protein